MTYGGMVCWRGGDKIEQAHPQNSQYPPQIHANNAYRRDHWRASHLRTFKWWLYDKIKDEDMNLLCTLGFPNDQVRDALLLCNGSKEAAAAYLFDGVLPNENVNNGGSDSNNNNNNNQNNNDDMKMMKMLQQEQFQLPNNNNNNNNGNNNNVNNLSMFLLEEIFAL